VLAVSLAMSGEISSETLRRIVDRPEQRGGLAQVFERELEEQRLAGRAVSGLLADRVVVELAVLDRVIEDRRVRRQPGHRPLVDVPAERAGGEEPARDVVEPQTLSEPMKPRSRIRVCVSRHGNLIRVQSPLWAVSHWC
jgi:hypothetical protein